MNKIEELKTRLVELNERANAITAKADAEKRDLSADEAKELDGVLAEFERVKAELSQREKVESQKAELGKGAGRRTEPESLDAKKDGPKISVPAQPIDRKCGFNSIGDYALAVMSASKQGATPDPRLHALAPTTYGHEGVGSDGGFAVPPDFRAEIVAKVMGEDSLLSRTDQLTTSSNSITVPMDETTPWQTTGGIQAYWEGEAKQYTASKPAVEGRNIRLNKITAMVPITEELAEDAPAMSSYLKRKAPEKIAFKLNLAIVQGNGVGMPQGILGATSLVTVAKETSQVADTINATNISKMWSRMYAPCRQNAVWLVNQDVEPQLDNLHFLIKNVAGTENVGGVPLYMPQNSLANSPFATLKGRPVVPTQACETLGDLGDILLVDLSKYLTVTKAGGVRQDVSVHLWFDYDVMAYKFTMRVAGQPWWAAAITPRDSSNTLSWAVALAERA